MSTEISVVPTDKEVINNFLRDMINQLYTEVAPKADIFGPLVADIRNDVEIMLTSQNTELLLRAQARLRANLTQGIFNKMKEKLS